MTQHTSFRPITPLCSSSHFTTLHHTSLCLLLYLLVFPQFLASSLSVSLFLFWHVTPTLLSFLVRYFLHICILLTNCGNGYGLWTSTSLSTFGLYVGKGMLPVKYFGYNKSYFASVKFHGDHGTVIKLR